MKTTYINNVGIKYHVDGVYQKHLALYGIDFTTTYTECRFPNDHRRQLQLNLTIEELDSLIDGLVAIRDNGQLYA